MQRDLARALPRGPRGPTGPLPMPYWLGTSLQFVDANGDPLGLPINLQGPSGPAGDSSIFAHLGNAANASIGAGIRTVTVEAFSQGATVAPARYRRSWSEPAHERKFRSQDRNLPDTSSSSTNGGWWEIAQAILQPEHFGNCGVDTTQDTAAWVALKAYVNTRGLGCYALRGQPGATYLISGSAIQFQNVIEVAIDLTGCRLRQQIGENVLTIPQGQKTLSFSNVGTARVRGGTFYGKAALDIANGITPTEFISGGQTGTPVPGSSSWNGTAAMYFDSCQRVYVDDTIGIQHAGGYISSANCPFAWIKGNYSQGIGKPFIQPIDNSADVAIRLIHSTSDFATKFEYHVENNVTFDHCFGYQATLTKTFLFRGNSVGPHPGQHGLYMIECEGFIIQGNVFIECSQWAAKMQHENYPGTFRYGAWVSGNTYNTGESVRYNNTLYVRKGGSGISSLVPSTDTNNWAVSEEMWKKTGIISDNVARRCGYGFGIISTDLSTGTESQIRGLTIARNRIYEPFNDGFLIERAQGLDLADNYVTGAGGYGYRLTDCAGFIRGNIVDGAVLGGLLVSLVNDSFVEDNRFIQTCQSGSNADIPLVIYNVNPTATIPSYKPRPRLFLGNNRIHFLSGDAPGALGYIGSNYDLSVRGTRTNSTKSFTVDGTLVGQGSNEFAFTAGNQNIPAFQFTNAGTDRAVDNASTSVGEVANALATLIADLKSLGVGLK